MLCPSCRVGVCFCDVPVPDFNGTLLIQLHLVFSVSPSKCWHSTSILVKTSNHYFNPQRVNVAVKLLTHIQEEFGSNLCSGTCNLLCCVALYFSVAPDKCLDSTTIKPRSHSPKYFPIQHQSVIILPFDAVEPRSGVCVNYGPWPRQTIGQGCKNYGPWPRETHKRFVTCWLVKKLPIILFLI